MPAPFGPNDMKELLNDTGGSFCDKFLRLVKGFPEMVYDILLYERNEDGTISDEMKADICALGCAGGSGGGGGGASLAAPTGVSATDGTLGDRVRITWNVVIGATDYDIYRRDTATVEGATLIGTTTDTTFDDTGAVDDQLYYYWIKARSEVGGTTLTSPFSNPDSGYISTALAAITDLDASQGFYNDPTGYVHLVWTPVTGAQAYDIYRSDTNTFSTATLIDGDRVPQLANPNTGPTPTFVDNIDELVYMDQPAVANAKYYYWVKAKRTTPTPAASAESNSAQGWVLGWGDGAANLSNGGITASGGVFNVPAGATKAWIVLFGNGGAGAGGNAQFGGGGGGGGAVVWGELTVATGGIFRLTLSAPPAGNAPTATNGGAGAISDLEYQPPAGAYAMVLRSSAATGGLFSSSGAGVGGSPSAGSYDAAVVTPGARSGRAGLPGSGAAGGRNGYRFSGWRTPGAHFNGFNAVTSWSGDGAQGGSGSFASPSAPALATGGENASSGIQAQVRIVFRA